MAKSAWARFTTHISLHGGLMIGPLGENHPFTKMFKHLISEEEAELGCIVPRTPTSVAELAKKGGISAEKAAPMLKHMAQKGVVFERITESGDCFYNITPFIPGFYEYVMTDPDTKKDVYMAELFRDLNNIIPGALLQMVSPQDGGLLKVTPVMKEVDAQRKVYSFEQVRTFLDKTDSFCIQDCACRLSAKMVGQGCYHPVEDSCLCMGDTADYYVRTGRGRRISKEEAIKILEDCEKAGLVHTAFQVEGEDISSFICNCCGCSCSGLRYLNMYDANPFARSNFRAEINEENCVACGECVEICPVNAITLGTSFCKQKMEVQSPEYKQAFDHFRKKTDNDFEYINHRRETGNLGTAPCKVTCPAHISVQGYIKKASEGKYLEALELIKKDNPLPSVCGRICPHPCEAECTRGSVDAPLAIDAIKMFIADKERDDATRFVPKKLHDYTQKVAVIGSGPAGLSAAYYLAEYGYQVTVFEKQDCPGGMLTLGIPSFRLEKDVVNSEIAVLKDLGVVFQCGVEVGKDRTLHDLRKEGYAAFYLAIGAQQGASLGLTHEDAPNVINGVNFLRKINQAESWNLSGKVIVVGGGNVAIDVARSAIRDGAEQVDMYCLESTEEMPAAKDEQQEALDEGIVFHNGWGPKELVSEDGNVTKVIFKKCTSVKDAAGRFNPTYNENETVTADCSTVLLSIGQRIDWGTLLDGEEVTLLSGGRVDVDPVSYQTRVTDIFAGGDVVTGPRFAIDAIAMGKQGAISIHNLIQHIHLKNGRNLIYESINKDQIEIGSYDAIPRQEAEEINAAEAVKTFDDLRKGLTEEQIAKEAMRCLHCGRSVVDTNKCIGCGVCTHRCNFDAIHLTRVSDSTTTETWPVWYGRIAKYAVQRTGRAAATSLKDAVGSLRKG